MSSVSHSTLNTQHSTVPKDWMKLPRKKQPRDLRWFMGCAAGWSVLILLAVGAPFINIVFVPIGSLLRALGIHWY